MVNIIKLSLRRLRIDFIIPFACLLFAGFLLFKIYQASSNFITNNIKIIHKDNAQNSGTIPKGNSRSTAPESSILASYICDTLEPSNNRSVILQSYCRKLPVPLNGWTRAEKYIESDIGFLIFTDSIFSHTKVTAMRDTWLSRVTHKYFLSERPYSWLPVTVINGTGDDRISNTKRIFSGLRMIYNQQTNASYPHKWYYLGTSDTFINIPHVLKRLDSYDSTKPFFLGDHSNFTVCLDSDGKKYEIEYPSINVGLFISSKLLALMIPHLTNNIESGNISAYADVALTCLIYKLGIQFSNMSGCSTLTSYGSVDVGEETKVPEDSEPNNFYSISPTEMYDLDEFYSFLHVDRLVHDQNWKELTEYIRTFLTSHYDSLRMKRTEYVLAAIQPED